MTTAQEDCFVKIQNPQHVLLYSLRQKHDCGTPMQFHRQNDPLTIQPTILQHDRGLLQPQMMHWRTTNNRGKLHG
jgi:hypothetical protein